MTDEARRRELAAFLRNRRGRLTPESLGLIGGLRRRTPGLRREEVAELAGLGLAWYTWLEQGRDIKVSDDVLGAIARALRLSADERDHMFTLARRSVTELQIESDVVTDHDLALLDALDPHPAYIRDDCWNLLAENDALARATGFRDVPDDERNLLWLLFMHPNPRHLNADWEADARYAVAQFRFEAARHLDQPETIDLIERLRSANAEFRELWSHQDVYGGAGGRTVWRDPEGGTVAFERRIMSVGLGASGPYARHAQRLGVLMPVEVAELTPALVGASSA